MRAFDFSDSTGLTGFVSLRLPGYRCLLASLGG
jgi:hypothetical protein